MPVESTLLHIFIYHVQGHFSKTYSYQYKPGDLSIMSFKWKSAS